MSIQDLGSIGEFVSSIAVVASLIYLALQIRLDSKQTALQTKAIHATAFQNLIDHHSSIQTNIINNPELRNAVMMAREKPDEIDAESLLLYRMFVTQQLRSFHNAYHLLESGLIDQDQWKTLESNIKRVVTGRHFEEHWNNSAKSDYPEGFRDEIDRYRASA